MRKSWRAGAAVVATAAALLIWSGAALAQPSFPALTGRVVDQAQMLSPQTESALDAKLQGLEQQTGRQLVVVTLPSLQGYEIEEFGYQLGRAWGIGEAKADNGALLIVAPEDRRVRIEVGYGLEPVLTDALSSVILQSQVLPRFREGDMEAGVVAGTDAIIAQLALPPEAAAARVQAAQAAADTEVEADARTGLPVLLILLVLIFLFSRRGRGGRSSLPWLLLGALSSSSHRGGGWGGGGFGGGGFSGGGGSFGGGGSSGRW
jgi:uncharacterized protein